MQLNTKKKSCTKLHKIALRAETEQNGGLKQKQNFIQSRQLKMEKGKMHMVISAYDRAQLKIAA
jgi:hypothetical protein